MKILQGRGGREIVHYRNNRVCNPGSDWRWNVLSFKRSYCRYDLRTS